MPNLVLIVNPSMQYVSMFASQGFAVTKDLELLDQCDLVCFTGGEDVSPNLYNEHPHRRTINNPQRDEHEIYIYKKAIELEIPCVGICRGGQFLNVMNGGKMYQDVTEHCGDHYSIVNDEDSPLKEVLVTSTHHQMMRPGPSSVLLMQSNLGGIKEYMEGDICVSVKNDTIDTEAVFYPQTKSLCFQPHPEFYGFFDLKSVFFHFINKYLF